MFQMNKINFKSYGSIGNNPVFIAKEDVFELELSPNENGTYGIWVDDFELTEKFKNVQVAMDYLNSLNNIKSLFSKKNMIAITGPYNHQDPMVKEERVNIITSACLTLLLSGKTAITPLTYGLMLIEHSKKKGVEIPDTFNYWEKFCLDFIESSDEVYVLNIDGWEDSKGVAAEIAKAKECNIPVYLVEHNTLTYIKVL